MQKQYQDTINPPRAGHCPLDPGPGRVKADLYWPQNSYTPCVSRTTYRDKLEGALPITEMRNSDYSRISYIFVPFAKNKAQISRHI